MLRHVELMEGGGHTAQGGEVLLDVRPEFPLHRDNFARVKLGAGKLGDGSAAAAGEERESGHQVRNAFHCGLSWCESCCTHAQREAG